MSQPLNIKSKMETALKTRIHDRPKIPKKPENHYTRCPSLRQEPFQENTTTNTSVRGPYIFSKIKKKRI